MALSAGKIAEVMFEKFKETHGKQTQLIELTNYHEPNSTTMQDASNVIWYPVQQHAPIISGWDLTGEETGIIEETYPAVLGDPNNDFVKMRADDLRTQRFWERRGTQSGKRQASELNKDIATAIATQATLFYRSNATSGYDFIAQGQAIMNERQGYYEQPHFILNDRTNLTFGEDLAGRQTLQGRPEDTWKTGQIGTNIAGFNVHVGSYLPNLTGGADPAVTVTGAQAFVPSGGTVNATTKVVTNVDYREASLVVNDSSLVTVGDKFQLENSAVAIDAIGLEDKTNTNQPMTFTVIEITDSTHIKIYPKPIAADQAAITTLEAAYANIDTAILNAATLTRLNTDASAKTNLFFDQAAVEVIGGSIPAQLFKEYEGMKVITDTLSNGLQLYMVYDGNLVDMTFRYRIFIWYGITICNPSMCGVAISY